MRRDKDLICLTYLSLAGIACSLILLYLYVSTKRYNENIEKAVYRSEFHAEAPTYEPDYEKIIVEVSNNHVSYKTAEVIYDTMKVTCEKYDAPLSIVMSMAAQESKFFKKESYLGASYGRYILMVSEIGLADYNRVNNTYFKPEDLMDMSINIEVGVWCYKQNFIYLRNLGYEDLTYEDGVIAYNAGCSAYSKYKNDDDYQHLKKVNYYLNKYF